MKQLKFNTTLLIVTMISFCACNKNSKKEEQRRVYIKYKNGSVFCDGINSVLEKTGLPKKRIGIWKFYYPDGKLEDIQEYDDVGKLINVKIYSEDGTLTYSEVTTDNITNAITYYENGKIKTESISQVSLESRGEDESEITYETIKNYFRNGQLYEQQILEDGYLQGTESIWDSAGNLALTVKYRNGLIVP